MNIINKTTGININFKLLKFKGGEVGVMIEDIDEIPEGSHIIITQHIHNSDELMELLNITDALRNLFVDNIEVVIPYVPYARQDRIMSPGESLSIKVFADLINLQKYSKVTIIDPHSSVTPALINNVKVITNVPFVREAFRVLTARREDNFSFDNTYSLVSPDAGALKKVEQCYEYLINNYPYIKPSEIIIGTKHRDVKTMKITNTSISVQEVKNKTCVIIDDICDGGRTFIELAKVLKEKGAKEVILIVTHGIFSYGFEPIFEVIDMVITSNSFKDISEEDKKLYDGKIIEIKIGDFI